MTSTVQIQAEIARDVLRSEAEATKKQANLIDSLLREIKDLEAIVSSLKRTVKKVNLVSLNFILKELEPAMKLPWMLHDGQVRVSIVPERRDVVRVDIISTKTQAQAEFIQHVAADAKAIVEELEMGRQGKFAKGRYTDLDEIEARLYAVANLVGVGTVGPDAETYYALIDGAQRDFPHIIAELRIQRADYRALAEELEQRRRAEKAS
jgi:hypothetical protein